RRRSRDRPRPLVRGVRGVVACVAPRDPAHAFGGRATAARHRGDHGFVSEQALEPGEPAVGAVVRGGIATPATQLSPIGRPPLPYPHYPPRCPPPVLLPPSRCPPLPAGIPPSLPPAVSQPSSCQRTRSTSAAGVSAPSWRQQRASRSPCSVSASTTTSEHDS